MFLYNIDKYWIAQLFFAFEAGSPSYFKDLLPCRMASLKQRMLYSSITGSKVLVLKIEVLRFKAKTSKKKQFLIEIILLHPSSWAIQHERRSQNMLFFPDSNFIWDLHYDALSSLYVHISVLIVLAGIFLPFMHILAHALVRVMFDRGVSPRCRYSKG